LVVVVEVRLMLMEALHLTELIQYLDQSHRMVEDMEVDTIHLLNPRPLLKLVDPVVVAVAQQLMPVDLEIPLQ